MADSVPTRGRDLRVFEIFQGLTEAELDNVWSLVTPRLAAAGELLHSGAGIEAFVGLAWSGDYRIVFPSTDGPELSIRSVARGHLFGEIPAFAEIQDLTYHVAVDRAGVLLLIARDAFVELTFAHKSICEAVLRALARTAVLRADRLFEFATMDVRLRLLAELLRMSHGAPHIDGVVVIAPAPTHNVIAAQVGTTREGVTRSLRALEREGLVRARRGQIEILSYDRLRAEVLAAAGPRPTYTFGANEKPR
jgi:CRP/FNR family transcriptional regulator, cyclic AMP receptor protein